MSTLTLRVPDDLDRALERQSAALGISKSDLARAQAAGINTDEDVFEALKKK
jgi:hypothetical protein